jgi:hypothetical protein
MWRSIKSCRLWKTGPFSIGSEKRLDECTRTTFPLCSRDVDDVEVVNVGSLCLSVKLPNQEELTWNVEP